MRFGLKIFVPLVIRAPRGDHGQILMAHRFTRADTGFDKIRLGRRNTPPIMRKVFHGGALSHRHNGDPVVTDDPFAIGLWCASKANQWAFFRNLCADVVRRTLIHLRWLRHRPQHYHPV
jgi:hypothetical protein